MQVNERRTTPTENAVVDRIIEAAALEPPRDEFVLPLLRLYYRGLPDFDIDDRRAVDLYAAGIRHVELARVRRDREVLVSLISPVRQRDGWDSQRSFVMLACDDAPFLVDSTRMVLERHGVSTYLLVHPVLYVSRSVDGALEAVAENATAGFVAEAWTQIEIDRLDGEAAESLRADLAQAVAEVHRVVADFAAMRRRIDAVAHLDPVLSWLADDNFVFLGAQSRRRSAPGESVGESLGQGSGSDLFDDPPIDWDGPAVTFARTTQVSRIHRAVRHTAVTVLDRTDGDVIAHRFIGLLASTVYRSSVLSIPSVGDRASAVLGLVADGADSHDGRTMRNVLETLPRDLVFELGADQLAWLVLDVVALHERQIVRVFDVPESSGFASTVLVFFPKRRFSAELPETIARRVAAAYGTTPRDVDSLIGTSNLARVTFTVWPSHDDAPDLDMLSRMVDDITTSWIDRVRFAASERFGEAAASELLRRFDDSIPDSYQSIVDPSTAVEDFEQLVGLLDSDETTRTAFAPDGAGSPDEAWRMRVYRKGAPISLSDVLPAFGCLGLRPLDEHPHRFCLEATDCYVYDIGVGIPTGIDLDDSSRTEIRRAFEGLIGGDVEADGFNQLIVLARMTIEEVSILRAYAKYAHQIGFTLSQRYVEESLARNPGIARRLVDFFTARFDPDLDQRTIDRHTQCAAVEREILSDLDDVSSLDDDRIVRTFLALARATVRTSAFNARRTLGMKFDPIMVPDLPEPRPAHEIFICSPRVEGVHLRGGAIARGGLRWSDRPEDYRTEVLGLVKAQMVKNAVIVPAGAKGGFVVKQLRGSLQEQRDEVVACYQLFVAGLLDLTDNLVDGKIVPPPRTVRYDRDDPYLVVAADKGTATFSDTANLIAADYGFWLGDAFASGGSAGYDHKAMGITARGAWESVRRHASVLGKDADRDELTVVGIGDMSGDVFGNGMLQSRHLRLIAAFDHRHVFIDPDPDPTGSYAERRRLFDLPRSSWAEYDSSLISEGGGVFPRSAKSIELSTQARAALGIEAELLAPNELIKAILMAEVDMLWNGGVGTYVKAAAESNADVGDRANDAVRVNGSDLRCKMVVEGGNLGLTQLGRVEFALRGGLVHTDAIDNSAGVDCSDHEVNIKVLLGDVVADGELTLEERDALLAEMTDEVADLVLDNNRAQTLALLIARTQGVPMAGVHARYIELLESEGWLNRDLEFLPSTKQLTERLAGGAGLVAPEFAVMIAYTKNLDVNEVLQSDLPDQPALTKDLVEYFPGPIRERFAPYILNHRLRREIATTQLVNQMVNLSGISYDHRMTEDTGASVSDIARAWLVAREVLGFPEWWAEIAELDVPGLSLQDRLDLFLDCRRTAERCSLWFLRHRRPPVDVGLAVERFRAPVHELADMLLRCLSGPMAISTLELQRRRISQGLPFELARRSSVWRLLHTTFDVVELSERVGSPLEAAAQAYWDVFTQLDLMWLWDGIGALPRSDRWQTQARGALRDDLLTVLAALAGNVVEQGAQTAAGWISANDRAVGRAMAQLTEIRRADVYDITNLSVALRQLRNLVSTSVRGDREQTVAR